MTDQPQPLDLDAIEARTDAASSGPWSTHLDWPGRVFSRNQFSGHIARCTGTRADENAAFIAHARTDVPALVSEIRRLTAELQQAQQQDAAIRCWSANTTHGSAAAEISQIINPAAPSGA